MLWLSMALELKGKGGGVFIMDDDELGGAYGHVPRAGKHQANELAHVPAW